MGTIQEFRTQQSWNAAVNSKAWTPVQGSSAWPINPSMPTKTPSKQIKVPLVAPSPTTFQWSSSWDPVVPVTRQKKTSPKQAQFEVEVIPTFTPTLPVPVAVVVPPFEVVDEETDDSGDADSSGDELGSNGKGKKKKTPEEKQMIEEELSKQNLYKTELCRSFCETGICRYGHKCQFAHGEHELRPVLRHPKYKTEICKTFSNTGTCPYGNRCRFIHPGMTWNSSWEDGIQMSPEDLAAVVEQITLSSSPHVQTNSLPTMIPQAVPIANHTHSNSRTASPKIPNGFLDLKAKEADVKTLVEEDNEAKPRLAFFQNLTVL